jgi:CRISPR type IV-associated protein Csf1
MNGLAITSSVIVAKALGFAPVGVPATHKTACSICGLQIQPNDLCSPFSVNQGFTDDLSLAARGTKHTCGYCPPLMSADGLVRSGYGVFSEEGVRPFRKWTEVADSLMNPPKPPFVMLYATAKNQHMAWRAPVNYSGDAFRVRVGLRDLLIRRQLVIDAVEACRVLGTAKGFAIESSTIKKTLPHPFFSLSPDLKEPTHGRLSMRLANRSTTPTQPEIEALDLVKRLSLGETWALRFVLTPNAGKKASTTTTE